MKKPKYNMFDLIEVDVFKAGLAETKINIKMLVSMIIVNIYWNGKYFLYGLVSCENFRTKGTFCYKSMKTRVPEENIDKLLENYDFEEETKEESNGIR